LPSLTDVVTANLRIAPKTFAPKGHLSDPGLGASGFWTGRGGYLSEARIESEGRSRVSTGGSILLVVMALVGALVVAAVLAQYSRKKAIQLQNHFANEVDRTNDEQRPGR
jgi:hypothetical protein